MKIYGANAPWVDNRGCKTVQREKQKKLPCDIKWGANYRTCEILMDFEMPQKHYRNTATAQKMTNLVEHLYIIVASCCVKNAVL
jgi:hypothetical protein